MYPTEIHPGYIFSSKPDAERFDEVIGLLAPHIAETIVITGSFAVEWNLMRRGGESRRRELNDIDLVVESGERAIRRSVTDRFLVHHYHPTREKGNVLMQLVEPTSRTRVDIFSARAAGVADRASRIRVGALECLVVSAEDLSARLLGIVAIVLDGRSVDPKYVDSLERLLDVIDKKRAAELWDVYRWGNYMDDFTTIAQRVRTAMCERGDLLEQTQYSQDIEAKCVWCKEGDEFETADRNEIYRLIGHV